MSQVSKKRSLREGYFLNACKRNNLGFYETLKGNLKCKIDPNSALKNPSSKWILFHDFASDVNFSLKNCVEVRMEMLVEIAPHYFEDVIA